MIDFNVQSDVIYFIDTNIWLYSFMQSQDINKTETARAVVKSVRLLSALK